MQEQDIKQYNLQGNINASDQYFEATSLNKSDSKVYSVKRLQANSTKELQNIKEVLNALQFIQNFTMNRPKFFCTKAEGKATAVYVFSEKMQISLQDVKQQKIQEQKNFTAQELGLIIKSLAQLLSLLSEQNLPHQNVKLSNIFLKDGNTIKVGDIGFPSTQKNRELYLPPEFMKPSKAERSQQEKQKGDVFCFGLALAEITTLQSIEELQCLKLSTEEDEEDKQGQILDRIKKNYPKLKIDLQIERMLELKPNKRPDINEIKEQLLDISELCLEGQDDQVEIFQPNMNQFQSDKGNSGQKNTATKSGGGQQQVVEHVAEQIKQMCIDKKVDAFELFDYFKSGSEYAFESPSTLKQVLSLLSCDCMEQDVDSAYNKLVIEGKMHYLGLLRLAMPAPDLMKSLLQNEMAIKGWSCDELFQNLKSESNFSESWSKADLAYINQTLGLRFSDKEVDEISANYVSQSQRKNGKLSRKDIQTIIFGGGEAPDAATLQEKLKEQRKKLVEQLSQKSGVNVDKPPQKGGEEDGGRTPQNKPPKLDMEQIENQDNQKFEIKKSTISRTQFFADLKQKVKENGFGGFELKLENPDQEYIKIADFKKALVQFYQYEDTEDLNLFCKSLSKSNKIQVKKLREKLEVPEAAEGQQEGLANSKKPQQNNKRNKAESERPEQQEEEAKGPQLSKELMDQITELFKQVDKDGSGSIEKSEIENLLSILGINASEEELDDYFRKFDKDGDCTISFNEFAIIMDNHIKTKLMTPEQIIDDLKKEFKRVDIKNTGFLNIFQLGQVFNNLGLKLSQEELQALFAAIDVDNSKTLDVNECIQFILNGMDKATGLAASAVLKIRGSRKPNLNELKAIYQKMPSNYRAVFIRSQMKKGSNVPSSTLRPNVGSGSHLHGIRDLKLVRKQAAYDQNLSVLQPLESRRSIVAEVRLDQVLRVPLPRDMSNHSDYQTNVRYRELVICLYDKARKKFIGNSCRITAEEVAQENKWHFAPKKKGDEHLIYVRYENYNEKHDGEVSLYCELVVHYSNEQRMDIEMTPAFCFIPLSDLQEKGPGIVPMQGGDANKQVAINPLDTFFQGPTQQQQQQTPTITGDVSAGDAQTAFYYTVINPTSNLDQLQMMPNRLIIKKTNLSLIRAFREYLGQKLYYGQMTAEEVANEVAVKTFLNCLDIPELSEELGYFWKEKVLENFSELKGQMECFSKIYNQLYLLITSQEFKLQLSDTTLGSWCIQSLFQERQSLIQEQMEDLMYLLNILHGQPKMKYGEKAGGQPFRMMDDDDDDEEIGGGKGKLKNSSKKSGQEATANILDVALQEKYRDNIFLTEATFLFNTEYINANILEHIRRARLLILDFTEQINRDRFEIEQFQKIIQSAAQTRVMQSLYLKLSRYSLDDDNTPVDLQAVMRTLDAGQFALRTLYLHCDYNLLPHEGQAIQQITSFIKKQGVRLEVLNLSMESCGLSDFQCQAISDAISMLVNLTSLTLNLSMNDIGSESITHLSHTIEQLVNLTILHIDLEDIKIKEPLLNDDCGFFCRKVVQALPFIGNCFLSICSCFASLEHLALSLRQLPYLRVFSLNLGANYLGDRVMRALEYSFGKALATREQLSIVNLNLKKNLLHTKTIKFLIGLGIQSFKVDLRNNEIQEEGLERIAVTLQSLRNVRNLVLLLEGNQRQTRYEAGAGADVNNGNSNGNAGQPPQRDTTTVTIPAQANIKIEEQETRKLNQRYIDFKAFYDQKILSTLANMPQLRNIETTGIGFSDPAAQRLQDKQLSTVNLLKLKTERIKKLADGNEEIPMKLMFKEEDDVNMFVNHFHTYRGTRAIHLQCIQDAEVLMNALNVEYKDLEVIDFADSACLSRDDLYNSLLKLLERYSQTLQRVILSGIVFSLSQIEGICTRLQECLARRQVKPQQQQQLLLEIEPNNKPSNNNNKRLTFLEISFFYQRKKNAGNSNECVEWISNCPLACMDLFANTVQQIYAFLPEEKPRDEQLMFDYLQRVIPKLMRISETVKIRELITYSFNEEELSLEIKEFDQKNIFDIRLFDLFTMTTIKEVRRLIIKDNLGVVDDIMQNRRTTALSVLAAQQRKSNQPSIQSPSPRKDPLSEDSKSQGGQGGDSQENKPLLTPTDQLSQIKRNPRRNTVLSTGAPMDAAQINQIQAINHLDQNQFNSFLSYDVKKYLPLLEELSVVFAPQPKEIESAMKNMVMKLCKTDKSALVNTITISEENRLRREDELDKEQVERILRCNITSLLVFLLSSFFSFHVIAVILPIFLVNGTCGEGHNNASHILFGIYTLISLVCEGALIFFVILPYRRFTMESNKQTRVWRRRIKDHFLQFGDVYIFLLAGCMCRFNFYADVLFLTISFVCDHRLISLLTLIFLGVNVFYRLFHFLSSFFHLLRNRQQMARPFFVGEILCEIAASQDFLSIPYLMDFESIKIPPLFCHCIEVPTGQSLSFLRLFVQNLPMFVLQLIFLGWELPNSSQDANGGMTSVVLAVICTTLTIIFFGIMTLNKWEEISRSVKYEINILNIIRLRLIDLDQLEQQKKEAEEAALAAQAAFELEQQQKQEKLKEEAANNQVKPATGENSEAPLIKQPPPQQDPNSQQEQQKQTVQKPTQDKTEETLQQKQRPSGEGREAVDEENQIQQQKQLQAVRSATPTIDLAGKQNASVAEPEAMPLPPSDQKVKMLQNYKISQFHKAEEGDCCYGFCPGDLGLFEWRDFSFFYEQSLDQLENLFTEHSKKWKLFFWIALILFHIGSFVIPTASFNNCEEGFSVSGYYIFAGFILYITVMEGIITQPLLPVMRELQLDTEFRTFKWFFDLFMSLLMKADLLTDYSILVYGDKCFNFQSLDNDSPKSMILVKFVLTLISVSLVVRALQSLWLMLQPLNFAEQFAYTYRFNQLGEMINMCLFTSMIGPYLPEKRLTKMRIPWQIFWQYLKILLEDVPMIIVAVALYHYENDNWRKIVIFISFIISIISLLYTVIWMRYPLKINREIMDKSIKQYYEAKQQRELQLMQHPELQQNKQEDDCCGIGGCCRAFCAISASCCTTCCKL